MSPSHTKSIIRFLPGLTDLVFLMPIVFLFARMDGVKTMLGDGDTGWHIRTGEWILAHGWVPYTDLFSFTKPGQAWFAWEWLWDVCFAWIFQHGGLASVVTASILVLCLTFALLFRLVRRHCDNAFLAVAVTFLACAASSLHWLARPHLFTMLFVVLLLNILDRVNEGDAKYLFALPLLTILWTNTHGGFLAEFIILAAFIAGEIARAVFAGDFGARLIAVQKAKRYIATVLACGAATLVNPYTYHLHAHLLQYFSEPYHIQNISEYQSISFHQGGSTYFEALLLLAAISGVWFLVKRGEFVPLILMLGWAHLALFAARNVPLFAIVAAPFIARACGDLLNSLERAEIADWLRRFLCGFRAAAEEFGATDNIRRLHLASAAAIAILALLVGSPAATGKLRAEYDPKRYPAAALNVLRAKPEAHIFADDEWGDYLIFQLYPRQKVFVDGRSDFYGQDFEQKYFDFMTGKYDWEQYLRGYKIDTLVLSPANALSTAIKESHNWRVVYDDTVAIVFVATEPHAQQCQQFSTASSGGKNRKPAVAKVTDRDRRAMQNKQISKGV